MAEEKDSLNFWRLFHCLLRHSRQPEETERSKATWLWMTDNYVILKKLCRGDEKLDLLEVIWTEGQHSQDLPGFDLFVEQVSLREKNEGLLTLIDEYKSYKSQLIAHAPEDLPGVMRVCADDWETDKLTNIAKITAKIANGGHTIKDKKYKGARDALMFLLNRVEEGVLIDSSTNNGPVVVQTEATEVVPDYKASLSQTLLPSGFDAFELERTNFVGVLGYAGDGKSTTSRYMLYNLACNGIGCLHISLENSPKVERNKYILLHAHNPKWNGRFSSLSYEKFKKKILTEEELEWLEEVAADFKDTVAGQLTIIPSKEASWEFLKTQIIQYNLSSQLRAVLIDYIQLLDPSGYNSEDRKANMTAMIKDIRQLSLNFDNGRGILIISPIQSNEDGLSKAKENEGSWKLSGINTDKELGRSMDFIIGVSTKGRVGANFELVFSCPKERDGVGFNDFTTQMSGCGWMMLAVDSTSKVVNEQIMSDNIGQGV